jgi:hypothetical protein
VTNRAAQATLATVVSTNQRSLAQTAHRSPNLKLTGTNGAAIHLQQMACGADVLM